ncbi:oxygenase MpaB family protein [Leifsonia aquatica]|uniref:oxygenase MpaB family protein n=1 Tax=Leifsonia aquatica TaxID=144185 RepID=UPI0037F4B405
MNAVLPPLDCVQKFRSAALYSLGQDLFTGFMGAYFRTFASPAVATALTHTRVALERPELRAASTAIVIYELIVANLEGERADAALQILRRAHAGVAANQRDFNYVLELMALVPLRWAERFGRRPLSMEESEGCLIFYSKLGRAIGVATFPATVAELQASVDIYERENVGRTAAAIALVDASLPMLAQRLPVIVRRFSRQALALMLMSQPAVAALGLQNEPRLGTTVIQGAFVARRALGSRWFTPRRPFFVPGAPVPGIFPEGYSLDQIGGRR